MGIVCIVIGIVFILIFSSLGVGCAYFITVGKILGQSMMDFFSIPNELLTYLIVGSLGLFLGLVSGLPLIMHGVVLRKLNQLLWRTDVAAQEDSSTGDA